MAGENITRIFWNATRMARGAGPFGDVQGEIVRHTRVCIGMVMISVRASRRDQRPWDTLRDFWMLAFPSNVFRMTIRRIIIRLRSRMKISRLNASWVNVSAQRTNNITNRRACRSQYQLLRVRSTWAAIVRIDHRLRAITTGTSTCQIGGKHYFRPHDITGLAGLVHGSKFNDFTLDSNEIINLQLIGFETDTLFCGSSTILDRFWKLYQKRCQRSTSTMCIHRMNVDKS